MLTLLTFMASMACSQLLFLFSLGYVRVRSSSVIGFFHHLKKITMFADDTKLRSPQLPLKTYSR